MKRQQKNQFLMVPIRRLPILVIGSLLLFFFASPVQAVTGDYNKPVAGTLAASEWNNLINDFVAKSGARLDGLFSINTATSSSYALDINGALRATSFTGALAGTLNAGNVSAGSFGLNTGGGNYNFPGNIGIGIGTTTPNASITLGNNRWISALNSAGTGYVNMFKVNANDEIEIGGALNIGQFQFPADSGFNTFVDMPVTSASPLNSVMGYAMKIDGDNILNVYSQSNGTGGTQNRRVGINTSTPAFTLDVAGIINASALYVNGAPYIGSQWTSTGTSIFYNTGNVGIGTSTPASSLDVNGLIKMRNSTITSNEDVINKGYLDSALASTTAGVITQIATSSLWQGSLTGNVWNNNTGNVGVGTTNPIKKFEIAGTIAGGVFEGMSINNNTPYGVGLGVATARLNFNRTGNDGGRMSYIEGGNSSENSSTDGFFAVGTRQSNVLTERLRITNTGNIGIGVTAPAYPLHVNGIVAGNGYFINSSSTGNVNLGNASNGEYLTIKNGGNVGIGTTTPIAEKLVVVGNIDLPNTNAWRYIKNSAVSGGLRFGTGNGSGVYTDGIEISSGGGYVKLNHNTTVAGNLYASGNVGIGTTTPIAKLYINGGTGDVVNVGGGQVAGLASTPLNPDHAVPLGYLEGNYAPIGTGIGAAYVQGGNTFGGIANLGTNDNYALNLETNSTTRMTIAGGGNVGIGTTTPGYKLQVHGQIAIFDPALNKNALWIGNNGSISTIDSSAVVGGTFNPIAFRTGNTERLRITNEGNVGIGTTNPTHKLQVGIGTSTSGAIFTAFGPSGSDVIEIGNNSGLDSRSWSLRPVTYGVNTDLQFYEHGMDGARVTFQGDGGNVGIGTTNPAVKLDIVGDSIATQLALGSSSQDQQALLIRGSNAIIKSESTNALILNGGGGLFLQTQGTTKAFINTSGYVGIGTTSPISKLSVSGGTGDVVNVSGGQVAGLASTPLNPDHAVPLGYLEGNYAPIGTGIGAAYVQGGNTFGGIANLGTNDNYALNLETNNATRMTIMNNGNVGVGTTTPTAGLQVNNSFLGNSANQSYRLLSVTGLINSQGYPNSLEYGLSITPTLYGHYGSDTGYGLYINPSFIDGQAPGFASKYSFYNASNEKSYFAGSVGIGTTNPGDKFVVNLGSAVSSNTRGITLGTGAAYQDFSFGLVNDRGDNRIDLTFNAQYGAGNWNERMRITNQGNVGIGTTTPAQKLDVLGNVRANGLVQSLQTGGANYMFTMDATNGSGPRLQLGTLASPASYFEIGAWGSINNFDSKTRDLKIYNSAGIIFMQNSTGNVGIGTTTPIAKLHINGGTGDVVNVGGGQVAGLASTPLNPDHAVPLGYLEGNYAPIGTGIGAAYVQGGNTFGGIANLGTNDDFALNLETNNATRMTIMNNGNVGIGTTTPGAKLDVNGALRLSSASGYADILSVSTGSIYFRPANGLTYFNALGQNNRFYAYDYTVDANTYLGLSAHELFLQTSSVPKVSIKDNGSSFFNGGNVGIGTTGPQDKLSIQDGGILIKESGSVHGMTSYFLQNTVGMFSRISTSTGGVNIWGISSSDATGMQLRSVIGSATPSPTTPATNFIASKQSGTSLGSLGNTDTAFRFTNNNTPLISILGSGNLGIGTTAPEANLQIGNGLGNPNIRIDKYGSGTSTIQFFAAGTINTANIINDPNENLIFENLASNKHFIFNLNGGNIGIGTTSPISKLSVSGGTGDVVNVGGGQVAGLASTPLNPDHAVPLGYLEGNYAPIGTGIGAAYVQGGNTFGGIANLGTNDNYALNLETNSTTRMTIASGGNVGIGTTNPTNKLDVDGVIGSGKVSGGGEIISYQQAGGGNYVSLKTDAATAHRSGIFRNNAGFFNFYDTNTGDVGLDAQYSGANLVFQIGSAEKMRISNSGNVGIGTTSPAYILDVQSATSAVGRFLNTSATGGDSLFGFADNHAQSVWSFGKRNTADSFEITYNTGSLSPTVRSGNMLTILSNGNVGIGTTNPQYLVDINKGASNAVLHIGSGTYAPTGTLATQAFFFENAGSSNLFSIFQTKTGAGIGLNITNAGNVGIGSTTPVAKLGISGGTGDVINVEGGQVAGLASTPLNPDHAVPLGYLEGNYAPIGTGIGAAYVQGGNTFGGIATLGTNDNFALNLETNSTTRMTIMNNGNVGIGTTNPLFKLNVVEDGVTPEASSAGITAGKAISIQAAGSAYFMGRDVTNDIEFMMGVSSVNETFAGTITNHKFNLRTGNQNRLTVDTSGNVGVGTTTPSQRLHISGSIKPTLLIEDEVLSGNRGGRLILSGHVLNSATLNTASLDLDVPNNNLNLGTNFSAGTLRFLSGSNVEAMRILSNGNVGIGVTAPVQKLEIFGNLGITANGKIGAGLGYTSVGGPFAGSATVELYSGASGDTTITNTFGDVIFNPAGNVGIGSTTPVAKLGISGGTGDVINVEGGQVAGLASTPLNPDHAVPLGYLEGNYAPIGTGIGAAYVQGGNTFGGIANLGTNDNYALNLKTNNATRMTIMNNGNVGIGTTTATEKLEVNGKIKFGENTLSGENVTFDGAYSGAGMRLQNTYGFISLTPLNNGWAHVYTDRPNFIFNKAVWNIGGGGFSSYYGENLVLRTEGVIKVTIASSTGNMGIGSSTPIAKLGITGGTGDVINVGGGQIAGLNSTPFNPDHAVPLGYLQSNYSATSSSLWSGSKNGNIWNGDNGLGNVGIGTTNPTQKLYVLNNGISTILTESTLASSYSAFSAKSDGGNTYVVSRGTTHTGTTFGYSNANTSQIYSVSQPLLVGTYSAYNLIIGTNNLERMRINTSGNVGIGTTDPGAYKLNVNGDTNISGNLTVTGTTTAGAFIGPVVGTLNAANVSSGAFGANTGGGNYTFPGNIGIGTTAAGSPLHVRTPSVGGNNYAVTLQQGNATDGDNVLIKFRNSVSDTNVFSSYIGSVRAAGGSGLGDLVFGTNGTTPTNDSIIERMRITSTGNIGIGTTAPSASLETNGKIRATRPNVNSQYLELDGGDAGNIFLTAGNQPSVDKPLVIRNYSGFASSTALNNIQFQLGATPSTKMIINYQGNVGIGTTDPGAYRLKVSGDVAITGSLQTQTGADFAEEFSVIDDIEPGTVVVMGDSGYKSVRPCDKAYDQSVVGVVSDSPSIIAGQVAGKKATIALVGVVNVKVVSSNGAIHRGDLLTTSNVAGHAMKSKGAVTGTIIGKALEDMNGKGMIKALVNLQ